MIRLKLARKLPFYPPSFSPLSLSLSFSLNIAQSYEDNIISHVLERVHANGVGSACRNLNPLPGATWYPRYLTILSNRSIARRLGFALADLKAGSTKSARGAIGGRESRGGVSIIGFRGQYPLCGKCERIQARCPLPVPLHRHRPPPASPPALLAPLPCRPPPLPLPLPPADLFVSCFAALCHTAVHRAHLSSARSSRITATISHSRLREGGRPCRTTDRWIDKSTTAEMRWCKGSKGQATWRPADHDGVRASQRRVIIGDAPTAEQSSRKLASLPRRRRMPGYCSPRSFRASLFSSDCSATAASRGIDRSPLRRRRPR